MNQDLRALIEPKPCRSAAAKTKTAAISLRALLPEEPAGAQLHLRPALARPVRRRDRLLRAGVTPEAPRTKQKPPRLPAAACQLIIAKIFVLGRPGSDLLFQALRLSTIGAEKINGRVRDGIGYRLPANTTRPAKDENETSASGASIPDLIGDLAPQAAGLLHFCFGFGFDVCLRSRACARKTV